MATASSPPCGNQCRLAYPDRAGRECTHEYPNHYMYAGTRSWRCVIPVQGQRHLGNRRLVDVGSKPREARAGRVRATRARPARDLCFRPPVLLQADAYFQRGASGGLATPATSPLRPRARAGSAGWRALSADDSACARSVALCAERGADLLRRRAGGWPQRERGASRRRARGPAMGRR